MVKYALVVNDLIVGKTTLVNQWPIPSKFQNTELSQLRFDGTSIRHISEFQTFYIDTNGNKHVILGETWQRLECHHADVLIKDGKEWRVQTSLDIYEQKRIQVDSLRKQLYLSHVDPLISEARIKQLAGSDVEAQELEKKAIAKRLEIQNENPWPTLP